MIWRAPPWKTALPWGDDLPVKVVRTGEGERRRSSKERQKAYAIVDEISRKMIDQEPEVIEETINEAVRQAFLDISPQRRSIIPKTRWPASRG